MEITSIQLLSSNIEQQKKFYSESLGFSLKETKNGFSIQAGATKLSFELDLNGNNFYHFAFLVADNHFEDCLTYVKNKGISILPDKFTSEEITYWDNNSGRSFYFYDADKNIVEFITRPSLNYLSDQPWSINEIIKINEIGTPVNAPLETSTYLLNNFPFSIPQHNIDRFNDTFCWYGSFEGTLLVVKKGREWYPTAHEAISSNLKLQIQEKTDLIHLNFQNGKFT
ncbi:MAG: hypothetical protein R2753_09895 [Chitinophagales bacterium]